MKKSIILSLALSLFVAFFAISFVSAHTDDNSATDIQNTETTTVDDGDMEDVDDVLDDLDEEEDLEGVEVDDVDKVPSGFGLWLRDWRERISLALTFDAVKKSEKQLLYAEERIKIAEKILEESTNEQAQQKAEQMIEIAQSHIDKIQERRDAWTDRQTERAERLKNNLAEHQLRRDTVLEKIEDRLPEDAKERFEDLRERLLEKGKALIGDIDDSEMTERTTEHLINVRDRIEAHLSTIKEYRMDKKEILEDEELSEEEKVEKIRLLNDERKIDLENVRLRYKETHEELFKRAEDGDQEAARRIELMRDAKKVIEHRKELLEDRREDFEEARREFSEDDKLKEKLEQIRENYQIRVDEVKTELRDARRVEDDFLRDRQRDADGSNRR